MPPVERLKLISRPAVVIASVSPTTGTGVTVLLFLSLPLHAANTAVTASASAAFRVRHRKFREFAIFLPLY